MKNLRQSSFNHFAQYVSDYLASFYSSGQPLCTENLATLSNVDVAPFILDNHSGQHDRLLKSYNGCLWAQTDEEENVDIKIGFKRCIIQNIEARNPLKALTLDGLNASLVVIEEISHLMSMIHHAQFGSVTPNRAKLELQAEIDKILVCSHLLLKQTEKAHWLPLVRASFDRIHYTTKDHLTLYQDVHAMAARFWFEWIKNKAEHFHPERRIEDLIFFKLIYERDIGHFIEVTKMMNQDIPQILQAS